MHQVTLDTCIEITNFTGNHITLKKKRKITKISEYFRLKREQTGILHLYLKIR
jgi:hypothetical protein